MNWDYYMKIQNAYGTKNKREKQLAKTNRNMLKHYEDTYDTEEVLLNGKPTKIMIVHDTELNTFKKKIKTPHDVRFNLGDYVTWKGQIWLITIIDTDDKTWNRGYMYLCTLAVRWQNIHGELIERWVYSEDFTKYSNGESANVTLTLGDNQYGITSPVDDETKLLKRNMRFPIDFDDAIEPDIYELTNRKVKLNDNTYFGRGGTMILTLSLGQFDADRDKRVEFPNGHEYWICDYNPEHKPVIPPHQAYTSNLSATISGRDEIKVGVGRSYSVMFIDNQGNDVSDVDYTWNIISDFPVSYEEQDGKIKLFVDTSDVIGNSLILQIICNDEILAEKEISVINIV